MAFFARGMACNGSVRRAALALGCRLVDCDASAAGIRGARVASVPSSCRDCPKPVPTPCRFPLRPYPCAIPTITHARRVISK
ncbi:hypothetical protein T210_0131550 [Burkholderia pseudomallei MSHR6137]|nr:hypothetical protein T210_0131550 [Burkholderia pseudomallei MSHR6137]